MSDSPNPYAASIVEDSSEFKPAQFRPKMADYISARGRATFAVFGSAACLVCTVLEVGSLIMQIQLLQTAQTVGIDPAAAEANDTRHIIISIVSVVAAIVSLIALLVWIYRAYANLPALHAAEIEFTPGWAVGWFFVPFMNLVRPYQVVRNLWNGSDPHRFTLSGQVLGEPASGAIVGWWWGLRIASGLLGQVVLRLTQNASSIEDFLALSYATIIIVVICDIPLYVVQILLIRKAQQHQEQRYELVEKYRAYSQPGPPAANPFAEPGLAAPQTWH